MHTENLGESEETAVIFKLQKGRARLGLKRWEGDRDVLTLRQVHSSKVWVIEEFVEGLEGDALITKKTGLKIGVRTADCLPIAFLGRETVSVVHAGWRGLKEGIVERALEELSRFEPLENFLVFIGPSAKACCYQVGEDFKEHFSSLYYRGGKHYMDTQEEALLRLKKSGIRELSLYKTCTVCHPSLPSHRRDRTQERLLTFVELIG
ncbi:MAG: polyphenol oxidase family protein [Aquificaceae bacterium]|nr:polyphenol oxidase family protein [Aquificaceae bacterium]MDW8032767.1 polyphenol oxidase family protein [Aquificaceae bacterium]